MQPDARVAAYERALEARLHGLAPAGPEEHGLGQEIRRRLGQRQALGQGTLIERFAPVFAGRATDEVLAGFCQHPAYQRWVAFPGQTPGWSLEEAFADFAATLPGVDPAVLADCRWTALIKALAVDPQPSFSLPHPVRRSGQARLILDRAHGRLYAAVGERVLIGALTPVTADLLEGRPIGEVAESHGLTPAALQPVLDRLRALGLQSPETCR